MNIVVDGRICKIREYEGKYFYGYFFADSIKLLKKKIERCNRNLSKRGI